MQKTEFGTVIIIKDLRYREKIFPIKKLEPGFTPERYSCFQSQVKIGGGDAMGPAKDFLFITFFKCLNKNRTEI